MIDEIILRRYGDDVNRFLSGEIAQEEFSAIRLIQGVYAQLQEGYHLVRARLPGGKLQPRQLIGLAEIIETYGQAGHKVAHLTTRQDVQFHFLRIEDTPKVLDHLASCGITTREASGNTVRNITACPLAGVCRREHVDVHLHVDAITRHFLGNPLTRQLPRKFKISISGCGEDCAQGLINDVALVATSRDGVGGFRLFAFGGLGAKPRAAVELDPFVIEADLLAAVEAVVILHHRYSDRGNRAHARSKFLRDQFTQAQLTEMYQAELQRGRSLGRPRVQGVWRQPEDASPPRQGMARSVAAQRIPGLFAVPVSVRLAQLCNRQLRGLAALLDALDLKQVRTTIDQNLLITDVPEALLNELRDRLAHIGLSVPRTGDDVVNCPGAALCPQAITTSQSLASRINGGAEDLRVRINGCQNSCAHSDIGDIGLYGQGRRHHGTLIPSYTLQLGGDGNSGNGSLAISGPSIPAARVPEAVRRIHDDFREQRNSSESFRAWVLRVGTEYFNVLLADISVVKPEEVALLSQDIGTSAVFNVAKRGIAECAGSREDPLALLEAELLYQRNSRNAFLIDGNLSEVRACIESSVRTMIGTLDRIHGGTGSMQDTERAATALQQWFPDEPVLVADFEHVASALSADDIDVASLADQVEHWVTLAVAACRVNQRPARAV